MICLLMAGGIGAVLLSLMIGESNYSISYILDLMTGHGTERDAEILFIFRMPRIILAIAVGGALSLAGAILQGIFRNPLVSPYTLGVSGGAALGATIVMVLGLHHLAGSIMLPFAGFLGSLASITIIYILSSRGGKTQIQSMLLIGVMISFVASASTMFLEAIADTHELQNVVLWLMGSLDQSNTKLIYMILIVSLVALFVSLFFAGSLNALRLGEAKARHLGINTEMTLRILFVLASLLTGISVSVVGVIGFVGLVVPHFVRLIVGTDYRVVLVASFLGGGIFLVLSDIAARLLTLPVGVITGIVGGTVFIIVLATRNARAL